MMQVGQKVQHVVSHPEHDRWVGLIVERHLIYRLSGLEEVMLVRWINPDGNPSDGLVRHAAGELKVLAETT